ncbi:RND transporter [Trinickia dabaoshanensis]|uniref:RND transporter n=2 Tax=Trinickia dabaoshanensis TaxID=564714 RepID=A0A2N7W2J2_9BURK|nr:efflux transporter outer membrane subunit [Trinickia dabaoshanensis]PMS23618.1 RND transporter [Trinickia dabaoshanensis]
MFAVAWTFVSAGCISLAPQYTRPAMPVPASYPADTVPSGPKAVDGADAAAAPTLPDWQDYFLDPRLRALIGEALANNRDLRIASARIDEAGAIVGLRRAAQFPAIDATATAARFRLPAGLLSPRPVVGDLYDAGLLQSSWEIDLWGRVRNAKAAALESLYAAESTRRAVTLSLIAHVADTYFGLCELDERLAFTRETIASRERSRHIFARRYEVGATSKLDLEQSEILLEQARTLEAQLAQARAAQAHALDALVGAPANVQTRDQPLDDAAVMSSLEAGLPSSLLEARPDIVAAEHRLRAANANIGAARAAFFPRIALTSSYGSSSGELGNLFSSSAGTWAFVPNLALPIFDAGRNRSNLALAKAQREEATAQYEQAIQNAFRDVADALSATDWLGTQVRTARATLDAQTERARLARLRYDDGVTPFLEVLDAQRDWLNAEQQLVQTRRALLSSRVALYTALGGATATADRAKDAGGVAAVPNTLTHHENHE